MKRKRIVLIILAAVTAILVVVIALRFVLPKRLSVQMLKNGDVFQLEDLKWGASELQTTFYWGRSMKPNGYQIQMPENEEVLLSAKSCVLDGQKANVFFQFRDDKLYLINFTFKSLESSDWITEQLEALRNVYGEEHEYKQAGSKDRRYIWHGEDSMLQALVFPDRLGEQLQIVICLPQT